MRLQRASVCNLNLDLCARFNGLVSLGSSLCICAENTPRPENSSVRRSSHRRPSHSSRASAEVPGKPEATRQHSANTGQAPG